MMIMMVIGILQVSVCAGANVMPMWGAFVSGVVAGHFYYFGSLLIAKLQIDDPLDATAGKRCSPVAAAEWVFTHVSVMKIKTVHET